jgi:hypothetical protein
MKIRQRGGLEVRAEAGVEPQPSNRCKIFTLCYNGCVTFSVIFSGKRWARNLCAKRFYGNFST